MDAAGGEKLYDCKVCFSNGLPGRFSSHLD